MKNNFLMGFVDINCLDVYGRNKINCFRLILKIQKKKLNAIFVNDFAVFQTIKYLYKHGSLTNQFRKISDSYNFILKKEIISDDNFMSFINYEVESVEFRLKKIFKKEMLRIINNKRTKLITIKSSSYICQFNS